jgi:hypothetical protein
MIADANLFGERKIQEVKPGLLDKKTPPGGERSLAA